MTRRSVLAILGVLVATPVLFCTGLNILIEVPLVLTFGWIWQLQRVLPEMTISPGAITVMIIGLLLAGVLGHGCLRWLWRGVGKESPWRPRWTIAGLISVMLLFIAGTAATGIVHQVGWIVRSPSRLTEISGSRTRYRVACASNMRQIGLAIERYRNEHSNQRPPDLSALLLAAVEAQIGARCFTCPASDTEEPLVSATREWIDEIESGRHLSFVYVPEGIRIDDSKLIVLYEPLTNHDYDGMNVLWEDGQVDFIDHERAELLTGSDRAVTRP